MHFGESQVLFTIKSVVVVEADNAIKWPRIVLYRIDVMIPAVAYC